MIETIRSKPSGLDSCPPYVRQNPIERILAGRHLAQGSLVMDDLTSTRVCGERCELAEFGCSRDKRNGAKQIEFGLLCDVGARAVAIDAFAGNTSDRGDVDPKVLFYVAQRCVEPIESTLHRHHFHEIRNDNTLGRQVSGMKA